MLSLERATADDSEVPIGTFHLEAGPPPDRVDPFDRWSERPSSLGATIPGTAIPGTVVPHATMPPTEDLEELYSDALAELEAGQRWQAQRLFEQLVARDPDSALAGEARSHLADLYRDPEPRDGVSAPAAGQWSEGEASRTEAPNRSAPERTWRPVTRPAAGTASIGATAGREVEDAFVAEAGDRVFFSSGSAEIGGRARDVLAAQARFILRRPELNAAIQGYADDPPLTHEQHERLAEERAEAVRQRLIAAGVAPDRLSVVVYGRDGRVSECPSAACAAQNRRVVTALAVRGRPAGPLGALPNRKAPGKVSQSATQ